LAEAYFSLGKLEDSELTCQRSLERDLDYIYARLTLAMTLAEVGRVNEARAQAQEVTRIEPDFSIGTYINSQTYRDEKVIARMVDGLRGAGLPD